MINIYFIGNPDGFTLNGMTATLSTFNFNSTLHPIPQDKLIENNQCSFNAQLLDVIRLSVMSGNGMVFRSSNIRNIIDPNADNGFVIFRANPVVFTAAQLAASLPVLPIVKGDITISTIGLALRRGFIRATGTGSQAALFGPINFAFTYDFNLIPVTNVARLDLLVDVKSVAVNITGTNRGLLGAIANLLVSAVTAIFNGTVANMFRTTVQSAVDAAVNAQINPESEHDGTTVTVETVSITSAAMTIQAYGGISLNELCATNITSGSIKLRPLEQVQHLRKIRNELLNKNAYGKIYTDLFYKHNRELMRLLINSPALLKQADKAVAGALKDFGEKSINQGVLSKSTADAVLKAFKLIDSMKASVELKNTLVALEQDVKTLINVKAGDLLKKAGKQ